MTSNLKWIAVVALAIVCTRVSVAAPPPVPDLTAGGVKDQHHDWTLGPTGARGWIWGWNLETTEARQILITTVNKGSPADGVLAVGDVIVGLNGEKFTSDARRALGTAITAAEKTENRGQLTLVRWRQGITENVTVPLKVMGTYGPNSPLDCPKSKQIVDQACLHLRGKELPDTIEGQMNALGLLATGRDEFLPQIKSLAHRVGPPSLKLKLQPGMFSWSWGHSNLFLTEYYLATGDESVLPAIREFSTRIAQGQSAVGTWGHGMSLEQYQGALGGYGAVNSAGLPCWLSLILAQKCGLKDATVDQAVAKSRRFFAFYSGKGSIPYGDHAPYYFLHDNNGKNALAAIAFDLLGDDAVARFFAQMSTASYAEREMGHTGNYFGYVWGPLGVARLGNSAVAAHLREQSWFFDLGRTWDGGFRYQGGAGADDSYDNWDMTGPLLLMASIPLKKLYITGRGSKPENQLTEVAVQAVIDDGRNFSPRHEHDCYVDKTAAELLKRVTSWSPTVRYRAAKGLALKRAEVVPQLIALLSDADLNARYGACQTLELMGKDAAPAVDALIQQLSHADQWLQIRAAYALAGIGAPARKAVPVLLKLTLAGTPGDPRETTRRYLGIGLFLSGHIDTGPQRGLLADSIEDVDRSLLLPAIRQLLATDDGLVRSQIGSVYNKLNDSELDQLWPDIVKAVEVPAPSGEMYATGIRLAGLDLLAKHRIKEGMRLCVRLARTQDPWASEKRTGEILKALKTYGVHAREFIPELRELAVYFRDEKDFPDDLRQIKVKAVEETIQFLETTTETPKLRSIESLLPKPSPAK
ncbi:MAG: acetylesterase [Planctomycetes bacterium]|nr:acetylesterase [Planctomycetota bacterium]